MSFSIEKELFDDIRNNYDSKEGRGPFYEMAVNLRDKGMRKEACLLLLSSWNFAGFRFVITKYDDKIFEGVLNKCETGLAGLRGLDFKTIKFDEHKKRIEDIFNNLVDGWKITLKGKKRTQNRSVIGYTGASKIMHLLCPEIFIMWDAYISGGKSKERYKDVDKRLLDSGWAHKSYQNSGGGYFDFLKDMKERFKDVCSKYDETKPITKAIDEFNYMAITWPLQDNEKKENGGV